MPAIANDTTKYWVWSNVLHLLGNKEVEWFNYTCWISCFRVIELHWFGCFYILENFFQNKVSRCWKYLFVYYMCFRVWQNCTRLSVVSSFWKTFEGKARTGYRDVEIFKDHDSETSILDIWLQFLWWTRKSLAWMKGRPQRTSSAKNADASTNQLSDNLASWNPPVGRW